MAKGKQTQENQSTKQPAVTHRIPSEERDELNVLPTPHTAEDEAKMFSDKRLSIVQRRALAAQVNARRGNRRFSQRVSQSIQRQDDDYAGMTSHEAPMSVAVLVGDAQTEDEQASAGMTSSEAPMSVEAPSPTNEAVSNTHRDRQHRQRLTDQQQRDETSQQTQIANFLMPDMFDATVSEEGGILRYHNERIILTVEQQMRKETRRIPFVYQYIRPNPPNRIYPIIRIVASPGVRILAPLRSSADAEHPLYEIYRVQDPESLPTQGEVIDPTQYTPTTEINTERSQDSIFNLAPSPLVIRNRPDGVDIFHRPSEIVLQITAPNLLGDARFAYEIIPEQPIPFSNEYRGCSTIKVVKTPTVRVNLTGPGTQRSLDTEISSRLPVILVYQVNNINDVPDQGNTISSNEPPLDIPISSREDTVGFTLATMATDTAIGAIPIVGDLVDIAEFIYGLGTGRDRWGRRLEPLDYVLLGLGAVVPFVSGGVLRGAQGLARAAGRQVNEVIDLIRSIRILSPEDTQRILRWQQMIRRGQNIPTDELEEAKKLVHQIDKARTSGQLTSDEVFSELGHELQLDSPRLTSEGGNQNQRIRSAVEDAREAGFINDTGGAGSVDAAFQPHRNSSDVRSALEVSGTAYESAHIGATSFLRHVVGYSRSGADTLLLPQAVHRTLDSHWKKWAKAQRSAGRTQVSVMELYDIMVDSLNQTSGLAQRTRNTIAFQLELELRQLGLSMNDLIDLPYPNVRPQSP